MAPEINEKVEGTRAIRNQKFQILIEKNISVILL